jgi:hypothetical protein
MNLSTADIVAMARAVDLEIPAADIANVKMRLSTLLTEMQAIERELGSEMDRVDPVPPVFPHEDF